MKVEGYRFDQLAVHLDMVPTEIEGEVKNIGTYSLVFPLQKDPIPCPQGAKLTKMVDIDTKPGTLSYMGIEFPLLGYDSPVNDRRIYRVQHPDDNTLVLKFTVKYPGNVLKDVQVDYKSPEERK